VADLGVKNPLILGQQLYGSMIPRPEYDEGIHQYEKVVAEHKMQLFKDYIGRINGFDGLSEFERKQLVKLDTLAGTPMSIGYEVVPFEPSESVSTDTGSSEDTEYDSLRPYLKRCVSVKLGSDKFGYVEPREAKHIILESDGKSTYCVSENIQEIEEEFEIVGTGRFHTSSYDNFPEDENDELSTSATSRLSHTTANPEDENEKSSTSVNSRVSHTTENGLSCVFSCDENMQVVCSPPSEGAILKCKVE
jgi:hypothetical protein